MRDDVRADALLAELEQDSPRGKLKIFLGAAPGVGKTYAMLQALPALIAQGLDVVVGVVETHGRQDTQELLAGLAVAPRRPLAHRGQTLDEMDLDGLLARRPQLAVVDELAHSNAPGSRHQKRYQDVEELLAAGIDVYSTLNVQHLESLNDVVWQLTGVRVKETLPDKVLLGADSLVLIDLPPRELLARLKEGKVYMEAQARAALQAFFSLPNLTALRELAMQAAASHVEGHMQLQWQAQGREQASLRGKLMVCLADNGAASALVRHGHRIAQRRQLPWLVLHVQTRGTPSAALADALALASQLGARVLTLASPWVGATLVDTARSQHVSQLLLGKPKPRWWRRSLLRYLLAKASQLELTLVDTQAAKPSPSPLRAPAPGRWGQLALGGGIMTLATLIALAAAPWLPASAMALLFVLGVLATALSTSVVPATLAALLGFVAFNFFFTEPYYTLAVASNSDLLTLLALLVVGMAAGRLAAKQRQQLVGLRESHRIGTALLGLSQALASAHSKDEVLGLGASAVADALALKVFCVGSEEVLQQRGLGMTDQAALQWCLAHQQVAGHFTQTLNAAAMQYQPLGEGQALALELPNALGSGAEHQLQAMLADIRAALARVELDNRLQQSEFQAETDRMRAALLSSVSHDLKTPLASIMGASTTLLDYDDRLAPADKTELQFSILQEAQRLHGYVQNLLDMTRLGQPDFILNREPVTLVALIDGAAGRLAAALSQHPLQTHLDPALPRLRVHPALIEQVLVNILDNAARYSPPGSPIEIRAMVAAPDLLVDIIDKGAGINEADRTRIFNLFYTQPVGDGGSRGTGLGLAISRAMVEAHGGKIWAFAGPSQTGTCMRLSLPLALNTEESR
ncbi:MAG: sensor histidine kinase KdpD [Pseudomonadota bacterium]|uniref:sensor histidine kinase n=1 Tax=Gallaecimonas pentaromativorans TaxID=584787 RepID=UPI00067E8C30|nr:sensor histidine kinase KdpD [Gallaecimonas pentaromativorans]MED5526618.1 sensor histidine kinase KdpD [Pseudomonadota bacterium]